MSSSLYTVSLSVNDPTALQKPTHIVMWQDSSTDTLANLTERLTSLEKAVASLTGSASASSSASASASSSSSAPCIEASPAKPACCEVVKRSPLISGISMERSADCSGNLCAVVDIPDAAALMKEVIEKPFVLECSGSGLPEVTASAALEHEHEHEHGHELEEVDADTDICPGDEDQEVDDEEEEDLVDEEEEAEEEEAVEYEEIEYKGVTYYKDSENQVYVLDADGDLDDTPVGVWNEEKKKVLKYAKA